MIYVNPGKRRLVWGAVVALTVALACSVVLRGPAGSGAVHTASPAAPWDRPQAAAQSPLPRDVAPMAADGRWLSGPVPNGNQGPVHLGVTQAFRVDDAGRLKVDAQTLQTLEQLQAFSPPGQLDETAKEAAKGLPTAAAQEARALAQQYAQYEQQLKQTVDPTYAPQSVDELARQFQTIRSLRVQVLGEARVKAMFADQDAVNDRLIALMQADADPNAPLEEKAMRAQAQLASAH